jgi:hypothetical protein
LGKHRERNQVAEDLFEDKMNTYLQRRWGGDAKNPSEQDLLNAIRELNADDQEHPDCSLSDEDSWCIAAYQSGRIVLENVETGEGPWHIPDPEQKLIMNLWRQLQEGKMDLIRTLPWKEGYE